MEVGAATKRIVLYKACMRNLFLSYLQLSAWFSNFNLVYFYSRPPREQKYYQFMGDAAVFLHLAYYEWWGLPRILKIAKIHGALFIIVAPLCLTLQIIYLYAYYNELSFVTKGTMFSLIPATLVTNVSLS